MSLIDTILSVFRKPTPAAVEAEAAPARKRSRRKHRGPRNGPAKRNPPAKAAGYIDGDKRKGRVH